jgi:hypothetical protein
LSGVTDSAGRGAESGRRIFPSPCQGEDRRRGSLFSARRWMIRCATDSARDLGFCSAFLSLCHSERSEESRIRSSPRPVRERIEGEGPYPARDSVRARLKVLRPIFESRAVDSSDFELARVVKGDGFSMADRPV